MLSLLTNVLYNTTLSDMEVGYKAFRGDLIRSIRLVSDDFRFEPEVTAKVLRHKDIRLFEVPISYYGRTFDEGKKITWRDGLKAVAALLRFRDRHEVSTMTLDQLLADAPAIHGGSDGDELLTHGLLEEALRLLDREVRPGWRRTLETGSGYARSSSR